MFIPRFLTSIALAATLVAPVAACAQQAPPPPAAAQDAAPGGHRHHGNPMRRALAKLNLSDTQKQQIHDAMKQSREANRNADGATRKANRERLRGQIDAILTPDQRTQLRGELQQMRAHRAEHAQQQPPASK